MNAEDKPPASPYLMSDPPTSPGRALLARAYEHYCVMHWGYTGEEIAAGFTGVGNPRIADDLRWSTRLLGELLARGDIRSWARPVGGGEPIVLKAGVWELDDFRARFERSALCVAAPFDAEAQVSHWIFVALDDWNRVVDASLGIAGEATAEPTPRSSGVASLGRKIVSGETPRPNFETDRLIRLPEVMARTSLAKATVYRRMASGSFPRNLVLPGNISVWRETEISDWIAEPR